MNTKRALYAILAIIALVELVAPWTLGEDAAHFAFEDFPLWGSLYGFVSCVAIIVVSKFLGKAWLSRRETYYDR